jgi:ATP-dependent RNA helicase DDX10/DBP4
MKSVRDKKTLKGLENEEVSKLRKLTSSVDFLARVIGDVDAVTRFGQLPLSAKTIAGLEKAHYLEMTPIQKQSLLHSLCGRDVLGTAKTGSGKTLAFLIPVLERLYREQWSLRDGLGALILSPTRELALQTFEVLRKIGGKHSLSAGLVIGGKDLKTEREAISRMNILVATPGRLLQHMDQTCGFDWGNLQVLVLDEADRILDLGFARTLDAILETLPRERQTLLFSATQTTSVQSLARLSLRGSPLNVSLYKSSDDVTPSQLTQHYVITDLPDKLDRLFSFIKANTKTKALVFLSSCKQVRFVHEAFSKLEPGVPLLALHGKQKQLKRMSIFYDFCQKSAAFLFATDIAARGLDFPAVDWVVQVDCPEDIDTYIHRVGRTARYESTGSALIFLLPSEAPAMLALLAQRSVPIQEMHPDSRAVKPRWNLAGHLQSHCTADPEIKYLAQKSLVSYVRSIHLQRNKKVFKVGELSLDEFARSLGLPGTPKLRFISHAAKNASRVLQQHQQASESASSASDSEDSIEGPEEAVNPTLATKQARKLDRMFKKKNPNIFSEHYARLREDDSEAASSEESKPAAVRLAEEEEDFFTLKRSNHEIREEDLPETSGSASKQTRRDILKTKKKYRLKLAARSEDYRPRHFVFTEGGEAEEAFPFDKEDTFDRAQALELAQQYAEESKAQMQNVDVEDRAVERERLRAKKAKRKEKLRQERQSDDAYGAVLADGQDNSSEKDVSEEDSE